jgi:GT2 family glycosyltransferase
MGGLQRLITPYRPRQRIDWSVELKTIYNVVVNQKYIFYYMDFRYSYKLMLQIMALGHTYSKKFHKVLQRKLKKDQ